MNYRLPLSSVVLLVFCGVSGYQFNDDHDDNDDLYYYENENTNGDYSQSSNGHWQSPLPPPKSDQHAIPCYSCHFVFQHDYGQGPENCKDPFSSSGIPEVSCNGACAKVYRKYEGKNDFMLSRNCMPNCKEFRSDKDTIECCTTDLCNGSVAAAALNGCRTVSTFLLSLLVLVLLLR